MSDFDSMVKMVTTEDQPSPDWLLAWRKSQAWEAARTLLVVTWLLFILPLVAMVWTTAFRYIW